MGHVMSSHHSYDPIELSPSEAKKGGKWLVSTHSVIFEITLLPNLHVYPMGNIRVLIVLYTDRGLVVAGERRLNLLHQLYWSDSSIFAYKGRLG